MAVDDRGDGAIPSLWTRRSQEKGGPGDPSNPEALMRLYPSVGLALLFIAVGAMGTRGADSPAASLLKDKGLTRSGVTFVIEGEKPVLAKVKELKALFAGYAAAAEQEAAVKMAATRLAQMEERRVELQDQINQLNQQINEQGYTQTGLSPIQGPNTLSRSPLQGPGMQNRGGAMA